ncbi:hypothetical protein [Alteromonas sp. A079]|uniref:hypothetical protein n=1 Tax=Alteromonas sp. A079 TaxID=3410268 RepID=UPI003BA2582B
MQKRFLLFYFAASVIGGTTIPFAAASTTSEQHHEALRFGEVVYSLYTDDALTSLSKMAKARQEGVSDEQLKTVSLLEGGVGLSYGMPNLAQQNLGQEAELSGNSKGPLALYWLARLHFSQHNAEKGLAAYQAFLRAVESRDDDIDELLTPSQWYDVNYEAAQASLNSGRADISRFEQALPSTHVTRQYLDYNEAVQAYSQGDYDSAINGFAAVAASLAKQLTTTTTQESWLNWIGWWQDREQEAVQRAEIQALLNQVHLSHGQAMLARGRYTDALGEFGKINGQSLIRDEALLQYGWGLVRRNDWPLAMGVWNFLSQQPDNLYTLQATHALALGYAEQDGEVQAYETLIRLVDKLDKVVRELDVLSQNLSKSGYWQSLATGVRSLNVDDVNRTGDSDWKTLWPSAHQDLLISLMLTDVEQQDQLSQLEELYTLKAQLNERLRTLDRFTLLLNERDQAHALRTAAFEQSPTKARLSTIEEKLHALTTRLNQTKQTLANESAIDGKGVIFNALSVYADKPQLDMLERLDSAQVRFNRLNEARSLRPAYKQRLLRLKGILLWTLSEQSIDAQWTLNKATKQTQALLEQAKGRQNRFESLLSQNNLTLVERKRISDMKTRITLHVATTQQLIDALEQQLVSEAKTAIEARRYYLVQQQNMSKLAILQLKDRWRQGAQNRLSDGALATPDGEGERGENDE